VLHRQSGKWLAGCINLCICCPGHLLGHDASVSRTCTTCFLQPDTGRIQAYRSPGGPGIRLDGALGAGNTVSRYYDSLLTKVHVHAVLRFRCLQSPVQHMVLSGVFTQLLMSTLLQAQVICHGKSYISAVQKMQRALCELLQCLCLSFDVHRCLCAELCSKQHAT
jgi:Biotin carboxylase C-terminal domain